MAKRGQNEGSVYKQKNGRWRGQVTLNGQRMSKYANTRKEITDWIELTNSQIDRGLTFEGAKTTIADYVKHWLASKTDLRVTTFKHYTSLYEIYIIDPKDKHPMGNILVKDLNADRLQFYYDKWIADGVGVNTIQKLHKILHQVFERAEHTGLAQRNVTDLVSCPRVPKKEMHYWTAAEAARFLFAAREDRYYALFELALSTGMRQMELLGLKWSDVDWKERTIKVERQLGRLGQGFLTPKTAKGFRKITLGDHTWQVLTEHSSSQFNNVKINEILRSTWSDQDLIFTNSRGGPVDRGALVDDHFKPLIKQAGVHMIRFHDMRHTNATILLNQGIPPVIVAGRLGHSMDVLMRTYAHFIPNTQDEAAQKIDELLVPISINFQQNSQL